MELFFCLYLGHLLGDFLFQPGKLVAAKREGIAGLLVHVLIIAASTGAALAAQIIAYPRGYLPVVVLTAGLHLVIEEITILAYVRTPTRGLYTFILDQAMHLLSMGLVVWLFDGTSDVASNVGTTATAFGVTMSMVQLAALAAVLTVVLFGRILVFEAGNAATDGNESKGRMLSWDLPRVGGAVERTASLVLALVAAQWSPLLLVAGLVLPFAPRVFRAVRAQGADRRRGIAETAAGLAVCVFAWGLVVVAGTLSGLTAAAGAPWWAPPLM